MLLNNLIEHQVLASAKESAVLVSRMGIQPLLSREDVEKGLSWQGLWDFDAALGSAGLDKRVEQIKIWNRRSEVIYSTNHTLIGKTFATDRGLRDALRGKVEVELISNAEEAESHGHAIDEDAGGFLEVYVPLQFSDDKKIEGVFEIYIPYGPIAATISHQTRLMYGVLLAGLMVLYLVLFRIVVGASKTLRTQAVELQKQAHEREHQAWHDALTGLPNRLLLKDRVQQAILAARREGHSVAVLLMDLDRFKEINDTLGHHHGDAVLQQIGPRLRAVLRESDTLARLGGDEFAIVLPRVADPAAAIKVVDKLRRALVEPFEVQGFSLEVDACVGIAMFPDHGDDVDTLIQRADVAMYLAKAARSGCEIYTASRDHHSASRLTLLSELRGAISTGELILHYQPKAEIASGRITGVEALVRWEHPTRGLIPPDEFIPLAEHTGLIRELTSDVMCQAMVQCRRWLDEGMEVGISVNLSMRNLLDHRFPEETAELLDVWNVPPSLLTLEITESTIMADPMRVLQVVSKLSEMGVSMSVDDFGTGYSSLEHLKRLPISEIKIDKSFVMSMPHSHSDAAIVRSTIDLSHNLGRRVVAEGVESEEILHRLDALGCDMIQGFYLSRPVPAGEITKMLQGSWNLFDSAISNAS
jgi:diguanylate cyclase (GGDEF)-like protein